MVAKIKIEGVPETVRAFNNVEEKVKDLSDAHKAEADMLLPDVLSKTRRKTGTLAAGWETDGLPEQAQFINNVVYAGVQEYGWSAHNIEPTNAVSQAFASSEERTKAVYADAVERIGQSAGFDTK
jgi:hypothetical protein